MCGIIGYIGKNEALPILLKGLKAIEYRGYDSAGVVVLYNGKIKIKKAVGRVKKLEESFGNNSFKGNLGIAHTRWATHGIANEINAHPHLDCSKQIALVHNGVIENYKELKSYLLAEGHLFKSQTDTESIAHLIEDFLIKGNNFSTALYNALKMIKGAYALAIINAYDSKKLYAARISSPIVIGLGNHENFVASDSAALVGRTKNVIYLADNQIAEITENEVEITDIDKNLTDFEVVRLEWNLEKSRKGNFKHFMLKEIFEGPEVIQAACRGRLKAKENLVKLGGLEKTSSVLKEAKRIVILGCGTSYHAGLIGEYFFEEITKIPTDVHFASEFKYRNQPFDRGTITIAVSQSGETADTLGALSKAKESGMPTFGIVNVVGSTIARETDAGVYLHAGPEIGVASTKAFLSQITVLMLMSIYLSKKKDGHKELLKELEAIPEKINAILSQSATIKKIAKKYSKCSNFMFLGRRYNYPTALEGALKLKEISYLHAEGYCAGEMKHGSIALINEGFPTIAIVPQNGIIEKMYSNLEEIKARRGPIIAIATEGDEVISSVANEIFYLPKTIEPFEPLLSVVPLQLFAYYMGTQLGFDVDKPRNLAKSVTVE